MKMRLLLVAAALLLFCVPARADSITVDVTGETCGVCAANWGEPNLPLVSVNAQLTVVQSTGSFWQPAEQGYISGGYIYQVTSVSGTFDGEQIGTLGAVPLGAGWWVESTDGQSFNIEWLSFTLTGGSSYGVGFLDDFSGYTYTEFTDANGSSVLPMGLTAVAASDPVGAPEPGSLALVVVGILALACCRKSLSRFLVPSQR